MLLYPRRLPFLLAKEEEGSWSFCFLRNQNSEKEQRETKKSEKQFTVSSLSEAARVPVGLKPLARTNQGETKLVRSGNIHE
jgi:hypothetical protein